MTNEQRRLAEELVRAKQAAGDRALSPEEAQQTLHELRVHQIELEMQNEALRKTQGELDVARARYFDLYDLAPVGYVTISEKGLILEANFTFAALLGLPRGTFVQQLLTRFLFKEDQDTYYLHRKQLLATGWPQACEVRLLKNDGTLFWARFEATVAQEADGASVSRVVVSDITGRKQAEFELAKAQSYITNILDSMPSVVIGVDPQCVVTHWNKAAENTVGISARQAQGRPLDAVFPRVAPHLNNVQAALREQQPQRIEREVYTEDSEQGYQDVMIYPLTGDGVVGAVVRVDDVTRRVQIEEMMVQSEKMMSVGSLAAGMAHEINNPLGVILQSAQVVISRLSPDVAANRSAAEESGCSMESILAYAEKRMLLNFLESIRDSGHRAADIVSNMLEFSRKSHSKHCATDMNTLLDKAVELAFFDYDLKKNYGSRQIQIVREYGQNLPELFCTCTEIEQVILNLLKNATQAMALQENRSTPPTIILRTSRDGDHLCIEVEDNGPGMPEAVRKRVFEPFYTTKPIGEGTGLGLSVSYFIIVTNHGGRFDVESQPGKGTRFIMYLPLPGERSSTLPGGMANIGSLPGEPAL